MLPPPTPFFKREDKVSKKLGRGINFLRKPVGEIKMGWDFFIFIFSLLPIMVTDTDFKKSSLGNLFLEKIVFYLKFKHSSVCGYLNYYYNVTNYCCSIPEKLKQGGLRTYFSLKEIPESFRFVTLPLEILDKGKLSLPLEIL